MLALVVIHVQPKEKPPPFVCVSGSPGIFLVDLTTETAPTKAKENKPLSMDFLTSSAIEPSISDWSAEAI